MTIIEQQMFRARQQAMVDDDIEEFLIADLESSDSEEEPNFGGSAIGRAPNRDRDFAEGHRRIYMDYFAEQPVYDARLFRRRFRMRRALFLRITAGIRDYDDYFQEKRNALAEPGLSTLQNAVAAIRLLAYGHAYDVVGEYVRIGESTASECLDWFCKAIIGKFGGEYLRSPTIEDLQRIMQENAKRGFPGMLGSIDCYNWKWKNCPRAWQGSYRGIKGTCIVLEAAVSYDLWFWHAFFGMPGSLNDINVLQRSPLLHSLLNGTAHNVEFEVNGSVYNLPYWLADGIYPNWPVFVKSIPDPQGSARQFFSKMQEACRKDIERAFGVLQQRFAIVKNPGRSWSKDRLNNIMTTCIILHNMVVEDERNNHDLLANVDFLKSSYLSNDSATRLARRRRRQAEMMDIKIDISRPDQDSLPDNSVAMIVKRMETVRDIQKHYQLQADLVSHLWNTKAAN